MYSYQNLLSALGELTDEQLSRPVSILKERHDRPEQIETEDPMGITALVERSDGTPLIIIN